MRADPTSEADHPLVWRAVRRALVPALFVGVLAAWYLAPWFVTPWPAGLEWAAVYAALTWRWPRWALALLPLTFPFWFAPVHMTARLAFPLSELALAVVALVVMGKVALGFIHWRPRVERIARVYLARLGGPVILGAALLLAGMSVGVVIAREPQTALRAWRWEIAEPLVYVALAVWRLRGRWLWRALWSFMVSGALVAALALAQAAFAHVTVAPLGAGGGLVQYPAWSGLDWRATAIIYGSPNTAGAWMARALPVALAIALWPRAASRVWRWTAAVAVIALVNGLALTGSRGAWLGAAAGVVVMIGGLALWRVVGGRRRAKSGPAHAGLAALGALRREFIRLPAPGRLAAITLASALIYGASALWLAPLAGLAGGAHGGSGEARVLIWQAAEALGRDHPLFGVGPDQFLYYYDPSHTSHPYLIATVNGRSSAAAAEPNVSHPHNLGLELWLSAGVIGLLGFMLALVAGVWRGISGMTWGDAGSAGWRGAMATGVAGALAAALAHGLVDSAYFQPDYALAFWWGVAALVALGRVPASRPSAPTTSRS